MRYDKGVKAYRFIVEDLPSIIKLAFLFNGNLFLIHRIKQLESWILNLQKKSVVIELNKTMINITLYDGWFSGFTDAEGCFNVNIIKRSAYTVGYRTVLRFIIDQNDKVALTYIQGLFNTGSQRKDTLYTYRYIADSFTKLNTIICYFELFPLKTFKKEAYLKWINIYSMMVKKEHLNSEGFNKIKILAKLVNDKSDLI